MRIVTYLSTSASAMQTQKSERSHDRLIEWKRSRTVSLMVEKGTSLLVEKGTFIECYMTTS